MQANYEMEQSASYRETSIFWCPAWQACGKDCWQSPWIDCVAENRMFWELVATFARFGLDWDPWAGPPDFTKISAIKFLTISRCLDGHQMQFWASGWPGALLGIFWGPPRNSKIYDSMVKKLRFLRQDIKNHVFLEVWGMLEHQNVRQYGQKADFLVPVCLFLCMLFCIFIIFPNPGNSIVFPIARIISRSPAKELKSGKALPTRHA